MLPLPEQFIHSLSATAGFDEQAFRDVHASGEKIISVRINPAKGFPVTEHFPGAEQIPWCSSGYYLPARPSFTLDPLFHAGAYYVQEASSMFLEEVLRQSCDLSKPLRVLDLCASPGGKSTLVQSLITPDSLLVSNEVIKTRVGTLADNITKWGAANTVVTNNDAKDFQRLPGFFDVIVVDAPCSGSGLFRKDNEAVSEWSLNNVELCSRRQQRILTDVLPALRPGGKLIYSTCSYSAAEDEEITDMLAGVHGMQGEKLNIEKFPGIIETRSAKHHSYGYRLYPDKIRGEGFFIAVCTKPGNDIPGFNNKKTTAAAVSAAERLALLQYIDHPEQFEFIKQKDDLLAFPKERLNDLEQLRNALYIKKAGVNAGTLIRGQLVPAHDLAMSTVISNIFPSAELELPAALDYLRKKNIYLSGAQQGWTLIKYSGHTLGFAKVLPGRVNNYYPSGLRILNR